MKNSIRALALVFLVAAAVWLPPLHAQSSCLEAVGAPYENGNQVCINVKNKCATRTAVSWTAGAYNFGIQSTPVDSRTGTVVIEPGKTVPICRPKPATPGKYCFRFEIKNFDQTKPWDWFSRWLNNITVAAVRGGVSSGTFGVGGSGLIASDVVLAVSSSTPGWSIDLSTDFVPAADFPATVTYSIFAPADAADGEVAVFFIEGFDAETGEPVGDATIQAVVGLDEDAVLQQSQDGVEAREPGGVVPPEPRDVLPPDIHLSWAEETLEEPISGRTLLMAWDANAVRFEENPRAVFEYFGPEGWTPIGDEGDRPMFAFLGVAAVAWDTTPLRAGDYRVRVTMTNADGLTGSAERVLTVVKKPVAEAFGFVDKTFLSADASGSFDPDGSVVAAEWDFGDGKRATGLTVAHDYGTTTGSYPVSVTVWDATGLSSTEYCVANLDAGVFDCTAATCGCESMDVKDTGNSSMPMHWMPAGNNSTLGGVNNIPMNPPAGGGPYYLIFNFEVEAKLKPGSNPALCSSHQWAKGTVTVGGGTSHKNTDGVDYPLSGDALGGDNYTGNGPAQSSSAGPPPTIRWVDGPGLGTPSQGVGLSGADVTGSGAAGVSFLASFFAMVTGPAGTCSCSWDVEMRINSDGSVHTPPTLKNESCS